MDSAQNNSQDSSSFVKSEVYDGISVKDLLREVHESTGARRKSIEDVMHLVSTFVQNVNDVVVVGPVVKDLLQTSVNNDNLLVGILSVIQRSIVKPASSGSSQDQSSVNSPIIPSQIVSELNKGLEKEEKKINELIEIIKDKST